MPSKKTKEQFIEEAKVIHPTEGYVYDEVVYINNRTPVKIICPKHGEFYQSPCNHLSGQGCPKCGIIRGHQKELITKDEFLQKATETHKGYYDYNKVDFADINTPVEITCPVHGSFMQKPKYHMAGMGCPECRKMKISQGRTVSFEEFLQRARNVHGDRYEYVESSYKGLSKKMTIICKKHGPFEATPAHHLEGVNCPLCARVEGGQKRKVDADAMIAKVREFHGDKYDYTKSQYINAYTPIVVTCKEHGDFKVLLNRHLKGKGCPKCARPQQRKSRALTTEDFIKKARKIHGDKYDYSHVKYINNHTKVCIICPEHGEFWQTPKKHLIGQGCPECGIIQSHSHFIKPSQDFVERARKIHKDKYNYSKVNYIDNHTKVCIICSEHGEFWQTPNSHLSGHGCPYCGAHDSNKDRIKSTEIFISDAKNVHDDKYIYADTKYVNNYTPVDIICPIHGKFRQRPYDHISGHGCPKCGQRMSLAEEEIYDFVVSLIGENEVIRNDRKVLEGKEIDVLIPSLKIGFEYNGILWHSEKFGTDKNYHINKTKLAESKGYHLIQIFEDEWLEHKEVVLNKIRHFLGKDTDRPVIGARKCTIKKVSKAEAESFLNTYHIQGYVPSTAYYGAFYEDKLIGVMTFKQEKPNEWNLTRFSTDTSYRLPGLASKIFKQFVKDYNPIEVKTFLDRRWSHGDVNVYDKMGFVLEKVEQPDYRYVIGKERLHKFGFRKQILHKKYGVSLDLTEREMTEQLGIPRIYDCGLYKYVWKQKCVDNI